MFLNGKRIDFVSCQIGVSQKHCECGGVAVHVLNRDAIKRSGESCSVEHEQCEVVWKCPSCGSVEPTNIKTSHKFNPETMTWSTT